MTEFVCVCNEKRKGDLLKVLLEGEKRRNQGQLEKNVMISETNYAAVTVLIIQWPSWPI